MGFEQLRELAKVLDYCQTADRQEEAAVIIGLLESGTAEADMRYFLKRLIRVVKKFAHKKYRREFEDTIDMIHKRIGAAIRGNSSFLDDLAEVERIAKLRFDG